MAAASEPGPGRPIRWGLVGLGKFAGEALIPAARRSGRAVIAACATRDVKKAAEFASRHGVPRVYEDVGALVRDDGIDAVYVATPNAEHVPIVLAAAAAKKHVLCEKPLALAEILRGGAIGTVRALSIERSAPLDERVPWREDPAQGGSILFDVGVHLLDQVPRLAGAEIATVSALASPPPESGRAADTMTLLLRLQNGVQATVRISREAPFTASDLVVIGTAGMLRTGPLRWVDEHHIAIITADGLAEETIPAADLYRDELDAFADDVADGGTRLATGEDGLKLIAIAGSVQKALG